MGIEKFLFKKIYLWVLLLILILAFVSLITFGSLANYFAQGGQRFVKLKPLVGYLISLPTNAYRIFNPDIHGLVSNQSKFKNLSGLNLYEGNLEGYLLLAKINKKSKHQKVELLDINQNKTLYTWKFNSEKNPNYVNNRLKTFQMKHPFLFDDGSLLFKDQGGPLIMIDKCSNIKWVQMGMYHHNIEIDHNNDIWVSSVMSSEDFPEDFSNDSIEKISKKGEIKFQKSIYEILSENKLDHLIATANSSTDPIHLNDIQPVLEDGLFWKKGDLFISLRNLSMIFLYRPSENKILWHQQGPWVYQHDVDIINHSKISIFNNNLNLEKTEVNGFNETLIYDFNKKRIYSPYKKAYEINKISTVFSGLSEILENEDILVEESLNGRILRMNKNGKIIWQYINRSEKYKKLFIITWSRYLNDKKISKELLNNLSKPC